MRPFCNDTLLGLSYFVFIFVCYILALFDLKLKTINMMCGIKKIDGICECLERSNELSWIDQNEKIKKKSKVILEENSRQWKN